MLLLVYLGGCFFSVFSIFIGFVFKGKGVGFTYGTDIRGGRFGIFVIRLSG